MLEDLEYQEDFCEMDDWRSSSDRRVLKRQCGVYRLEALLDILRFYVMPLICRVNGHDLVDTSYAGPDHGDVAYECRRCNYQFRQPLY